VHKHVRARIKKTKVKSRAKASATASTNNMVDWNLEFAGAMVICSFVE
jgi:hypothetical protein